MKFVGVLISFLCFTVCNIFVNGLLIRVGLIGVEKIVNFLYSPEFRIEYLWAVAMSISVVFTAICSLFSGKKKETLELTEAWATFLSIILTKFFIAILLSVILRVVV